MFRWNQSESSTTVAFPNKLNIGCGYDKRAGYLNVDIDPNCMPDLLLGEDGDLGALPKQYFEEILARDVLEHFPRSESLRNLLIWNKHLQMDGKLRVVTSDILSVATKMTENMTYANHHGWTLCLFGNQKQPGDFHLTGFTEIVLEVLLSAAGFKVTTKGHIDEWCFDWSATKVDDWTEWIKEEEQSSNVQFLTNTYRKCFGRELDNEGESFYSDRLKKGCTRESVFLDLASSPEAIFVHANLLNR